MDTYVLDRPYCSSPFSRPRGFEHIHPFSDGDRSRAQALKFKLQEKLYIGRFRDSKGAEKVDSRICESPR